MNLYEILTDNSNLNVTINAGQLIDCIDYALRKQFEKSQNDEKEEFLTTDETCKTAKISRPTLHRWKKAGLIPYVKIGKNVRYKYSDLMDVLNKRKENRE